MLPRATSLLLLALGPQPEHAFMIPTICRPPHTALRTPCMDGASEQQRLDTMQRAIDEFESAGITVPAALKQQADELAVQLAGADVAVGSQIADLIADVQRKKADEAKPLPLSALPRDELVAMYGALPLSTNAALVGRAAAEKAMAEWLEEKIGSAPPPPVPDGAAAAQVADLIADVQRKKAEEEEAKPLPLSKLPRDELVAMYGEPPLSTNAALVGRAAADKAMAEWLQRVATPPPGRRGRRFGG